LNTNELKNFLNEKVIQYNNPKFIESDPIQIPHKFSKKEDIEIAAFLTATIAWGNRKMIIKNADAMMQRMDYSPHDFIVNHTANDLKVFDGFVHRTFNALDLQYFIASLKHIYLKYNSLETLFKIKDSNNNAQENIAYFKDIFFSLPHLQRTTKHISNPAKGSAAKRINMFLRWMVRDDNAGVDFGLWKSISPSQLSCPLDVHSGNVARKLGLLKRKQNDAKAVIELDAKLRSFDPNDPVKYDFALFGLGVFEKF